MSSNLNGNIVHRRKRFCVVLKKVREQAGLSQAQLADLAGISVDNYQNWEQGRCEPSMLKFQPVIAALGEHAKPLLKEIGYTP